MGKAPLQAPAPPQFVLDAWGVTDAEPLTGGQGEAFRAGDLVLKPVHDATRATWLADVLDALPVCEQVRIARPAPALDGSWLVDGWSAWHWLHGVHREGAWEDVLDVSERFHRAVVDVAWSPAMVAADRWAAADRVAWGEAERVLPRAVRPLLERRQPVHLPSQLVHGDLGGNVLFHDSLPPAVIDVSLYWRPVGYAAAIVVADAVAFGGADDELVEQLLRDQGDQLLLRAVLFRVATAPDEVVAYQRVISLLGA